MKDNDKLVALIRLRDLIYSGVRPTVRESGFSAEIIQELFKEQLIQPGAEYVGDDPNTYSIKEILPPGHSFISQQHALRDLHNLTPEPA